MLVRNIDSSAYASNDASTAASTDIVKAGYDDSLFDNAWVKLSVINLAFLYKANT